MSEIKTQCPNCHGSFEVSADLGGQAYQCPDCSANLILPLAKFATPHKNRAGFSGLLLGCWVCPLWLYPFS